VWFGIGYGTIAEAAAVVVIEERAWLVEKGYVFVSGIGMISSTLN